MRVVRWIGSDKKRFRELMALFLRGEYRVTQRAAWVLRHCAERDQSLVEPYLAKMVNRMLEPGVHVAVKRNVVGILQEIEIPRRLLGRIATICFDFLASQDETIAVRAFSMTVLANIAASEPDLKNELRLMIEQQLPWEGAAFQSRARHVLKQLNGGKAT